MGRCCGGAIGGVGLRVCGGLVMRGDVGCGEGCGELRIGFRGVGSCT